VNITSHPRGWVRHSDPAPELADSGDSPAAAALGTTMTVLSQQHATATSALDELARHQHATPVSAIENLRADVWDSDEELDEFLVDWRAARSSSPS
jgi:hypothetical protein